MEDSPPACIRGSAAPFPLLPPPPPAPLKLNIGPRSCEASSPAKITLSLGCLARSRHALRAAKLCEHRSQACVRALSLLQLRSFFAYATTVLAVDVDQRPVLLPSSRFRPLFLSSFSCSLIAVELHCDAWCSHEAHSTLQPLCGSVRVRCCRIFVIALL